MRRLAQSALKFLNQPRLAEPRLANDQCQLPIALACSLPAPHQYGDLLVATDEWREMALSSAAAPTTRPHDAKESDRLRYALERMSAAFLGDEQPGDLALKSRRDHDRAGLGSTCSRAAILATSP
jgi:hypothetical protein